MSNKIYQSLQTMFDTDFRYIHVKDSEYPHRQAFPAWFATIYYPGCGNSVSDRNSTRAPLAGSAVFVGGMEDALHYDTVTVTIDADADATLIVQESTDGSYITSQTQFFYLTGSSMSFSHQLKTKYFNVRFVCGALPITILQLQTIMRVSPYMK